MNAQQVWQTQAIEAPRISLEYVRHRTSSLEQRTRWRNALEYVVGACALVMFVSSGLRHFPEKPIMVVAHGWFALWTLFYVYWWHRLAASQATPADAGVLDNLRYQRRQLERQRDARLDSWRWWGLPSLPGFVLFSGFHGRGSSAGALGHGHFSGRLGGGGHRHWGVAHEPGSAAIPARDRRARFAGRHRPG